MKVKARNFKSAVEATPHIAGGYCEGLRALGANSDKVQLGDTRQCDGSVDIDACLRQAYPQSNRWDYVFSYKEEVYFVEVHTANTREVRTVINKLKWLRAWLTESAPELDKLRTKSRGNPFYWIQSGNFKIPSTSPQYREISQCGIKPIPKLTLD